MKHRPIAASDLQTVFAIYMDPENNPFLNYEPMTVEEFRPIFDDLVDSGCTHLLVDAVDVVGTFSLRLQQRRCAHVATLGSFAMHPSFRGLGLGGRAIEQIVLLARSKGARRLELLVETDNARAIRFYEKNGFTREAILRGAFRRASDAQDMDELVMARLLR
jgi:RimJ/RimL family protein N-acetyltransferase